MKYDHSELDRMFPGGQAEFWASPTSWQKLQDAAFIDFHEDMEQTFDLAPFSFK